MLRVLALGQRGGVRQSQAPALPLLCAEPLRCENNS